MKNSLNKIPAQDLALIERFLDYELDEVETTQFFERMRIDSVFKAQVAFCQRVHESTLDLFRTKTPKPLANVIGGSETVPQAAGSSEVQSTKITAPIAPTKRPQVPKEAKVRPLENGSIKKKTKRSILRNLSAIAACFLFLFAVSQYGPTAYPDDNKVLVAMNIADEFSDKHNLTSTDQRGPTVFKPIDSKLRTVLRTAKEKENYQQITDITKNVEDPEALLLRAIALKEAKKWEEAKTLFLQISALGNTSDKDVCYWGLVDIYLHQKDIKAARKQLQELMKEENGVPVFGNYSYTQAEKALAAIGK